VVDDVVDDVVDVVVVVVVALLFDPPEELFDEPPDPPDPALEAGGTLET